MNYRDWLTVGIFLILVWASLLIFLYTKADEVTKDPCTVCSKRMGDKWMCYSEKSKVEFLPNGTINTNQEELIKDAWKSLDENRTPNVNFSNFQK